MPTLLLLLCSLGPTAAANEAPEPISASDWQEPAAAPAPAADPLPLLHHLLASGDYAGLRTEALKASFELPADHPDLDEVRYLAAVAALRLDEDIDELRVLTDLESQVGELSQLQLADHWSTVAPRLSVNAHQDWMEEHPDSPWRTYSAKQIAWNLASDGYFSMALTALDNEQIPVSDPLRVSLSTPPAWKRPVIAAALSGALPGAGQLYAGQPREAFSALFVNAIFIGATAWAIKQQNWPAAGVIGFFGLGFYSGNIYGAADAAIRHNRGVRDETLDAMEAEGLGPDGDSLVPQP